MTRLAARVAGRIITGFAWLITAVRAVWQGSAPLPDQRIYFANHRSNGDFILIWSVLPTVLRQRTRPVAAADYWLAGPVRRFIGRDVFRAVLIERNAEDRRTDPLRTMLEALERGDSLILFPEGTRNMTESPLLRFRSGLYNLALANPDVDLVPVWIDNLNGVLPKGRLVPVPLLCTVTFGASLRLADGEDRRAFLDRAADALLSLGAAA
ncbi:lysophospholipid acyltransferase family protein [Oceaniglobus roseus]|uniref:lysophospholipid acyltransferase family protein n=1 Tax=Oceaniglobus roseus TaxID=1737570 RepID=UPI000C7F371A|nr:lysophospholipid acyltransferase family protein [Kandeliimicrobium roseum]